MRCLEGILDGHRWLEAELLAKGEEGSEPSMVTGTVEQVAVPGGLKRSCLRRFQVGIQGFSRFCCCCVFFSKLLLFYHVSWFVHVCSWIFTRCFHGFSSGFEVLNLHFLACVHGIAVHCIRSADARGEVRRLLLKLLQVLNESRGSFHLSDRFLVWLGTFATGDLGPNSWY